MDKVDLTRIFADLGASRPSAPGAPVSTARIRVVRPDGARQWDRYPHDGFALVPKRRLCERMRDREVVLDAGQGLLVGRGVKHQAIAAGDTHPLLVETDPAA